MIQSDRCRDGRLLDRVALSLNRCLFSVRLRHLEQKFAAEGGFTERLYHARQRHRRNHP